jgi:hypothetical protein
LAIYAPQKPLDMTNEDFAHVMSIGSKKGVVRTPQFPGVLTDTQDTGKLIEQVRALIKKQKRARGFLFGIQSGSGNLLNLELSGTARTFLGFSILFSPDEDFSAQPNSITLTINNEIIIQDVQPSFFSPDFMDDEYYYFPRPLSGSDVIQMTAEGNDDINMKIIVYYI